MFSYINLEIYCSVLVGHIVVLVWMIRSGTADVWSPLFLIIYIFCSIYIYYVLHQFIDSPLVPNVLPPPRKWTCLLKRDHFKKQSSNYYLWGIAFNVSFLWFVLHKKNKTAEKSRWSNSQKVAEKIRGHDKVRLIPYNPCMVCMVYIYLHLP